MNLPNQPFNKLAVFGLSCSLVRSFVSMADKLPNLNEPSHNCATVVVVVVIERLCKQNGRPGNRRRRRLARPPNVILVLDVVRICV